MSAISKEDAEVISGFLRKASESTLVQSMSRLQDFLVEKKLAWKQQLHCSLVGCSEHNRDGQGVSASHVHDLISSIASIGFTAEEAKGVCLEIPGDARGEACRLFNDRMVEASHGKLAPVDHSQLRFASTVGSHANQAARAFVAGLEHKDPAVTMGGKLSLDKLAMVDPQWHKCITKGLEWLVISQDVWLQFPDFALLAQTAGNAAGQIAAAEHEIQLAKKVNMAIAGFLRRTGKESVCYVDISQEILRSRPPHASSVPGIFTFVLKFGGGIQLDSFMAKSEHYIVTHGHPTRSIGGEIWAALAMDCKGKDQHVVFRHMLLKLAFCGHERCLTQSDVKRALGGKELATKVAQAEALRLQVVGLLGPTLPNRSDLDKAVSDLEVLLAACVLQKKKVTKAETLEEICAEVLAAHGVESPFSNKIVDSPQPASSKPSASQGSFLEACYALFRFEIGNLLRWDGGLDS